MTQVARTTFLSFCRPPDPSNPSGNPYSPAQTLESHSFHAANKTIPNLSLPPIAAFFLPKPLPTSLNTLSQSKFRIAVTSEMRLTGRRLRGTLG